MYKKTFWLNSDFTNGAKISLNLGYLINNLCTHDKIKVMTTSQMWETLNVPKKYMEYQKKVQNINMINFMKWQESKEKGIEKILDRGLPPEKIDPIIANYNLAKKYFTITNGITRIRIFKKRNIDKINANIFLDYDF